MRLDRVLPDDDRQAWTRHYAGPRPDTRRPACAVLVFRVGAEWLALPAASIKEVSEPILTLPRRRAGGALGLVNLHGDLIVHVSLAQLLEIDAREPLSGAGAARAVRRLVVVGDEIRRLAFDVDEVSQLHRYDPSELRHVPSTLPRSVVSYVAGVLPFAGRTIGFLDAERTLSALSARLG